MANEPESGADEVPTQPLPEDGMVAPHVPIADVPTVPLDATDVPGVVPTPPISGPPPASAPPRRPNGRPPLWFWVLIAAVVLGATIAIILGLSQQGSRAPAPLDSPSTAPSPTSQSEQPSAPPVEETPTQPAQPPAPPAPTEPPEPPPTATPQPTETSAP